MSIQSTSAIVVLLAANTSLLHLSINLIVVRGQLVIRSLVEEDLRFLVTQAVILVDFFATDALNRGKLVRINETHVGVAL